MPKQKRTHIALIDDNVQYCKQLQKEAKNYGFKISYFHNLETGIETIEQTPTIKAVILDGHCPIEPEQAPETGKSNFVFHALHRLTDVEHIYNRFLPYCVNTSEPNDFKEDL